MSKVGGSRVAQTMENGLHTEHEEKEDEKTQAADRLPGGKVLRHSEATDLDEIFSSEVPNRLHSVMNEPRAETESIDETSSNENRQKNVLWILMMIIIVAVAALFFVEAVEDGLGTDEDSQGH